MAKHLVALYQNSKKKAEINFADCEGSKNSEHLDIPEFSNEFDDIFDDENIN